MDETRVLIVSPEPGAAGICDAVLRHARPNYAVYTANDGLEAAEMAGRLLPDLIFVLGTSSVTGIDGLTLCEILHTNPRLRKAKIVLASAHHPLYIIGASLLSGAVEFLPKPFVQKDLLEIIARLLRKR